MKQGKTAPPSPSPTGGGIVGTSTASPVRPAVPDPPAGSAPAQHMVGGKARTSVRPRRSVWRRILQVLIPPLCAALLGGGAWAYGASRPASYSSEALVSVLPTNPANPVSTAVTSIWVQIGNSDALRTQAAQRLGVTEGQLAGVLKISQAGDAALVSVVVTTGSSARSAEWANGVAEALVERSDRNFVAGYQLTQVTSALPAQAKDRFSSLMVAAAAVVGFLIGLAMVQAWGRHDRRRARTDGAAP